LILSEWFLEASANAFDVLANAVDCPAAGECPDERKKRGDQSAEFGNSKDAFHTRFHGCFKKD
jgi:hypothetical protein